MSEETREVNNPQPVAAQTETRNQKGGATCAGDKAKKTFDLEERTARFGEDVIDLVRRVKKDEVNLCLIGQVVRSATSIGANYAEGDATQTKKDFRHRIGICLRESKETKHWLRMFAKANEHVSADCRRLWQEANELTLIFSAIIRSTGTTTE